MAERGPLRPVTSFDPVPSQPHPARPLRPLVPLSVRPLPAPPPPPPPRRVPLDQPKRPIDPPTRNPLRRPLLSHASSSFSPRPPPRPLAPLVNPVKLVSTVPPPSPSTSRDARSTPTPTKTKIGLTKLVDLNSIDHTETNPLDRTRDDASKADEFDPSPRKKRKGFLTTGMASRAAAVLSARRTDHSLWLHDLSRKLHPRSEDPRRRRPAGANPERGETSSSSSRGTGTNGAARDGWTKREMNDALRPDLKLRVLEIVRSDRDSAGEPGTRDEERRGAHPGYGGGKTVLAKCLLVLPDGGRDAGEPDRPSRRTGPDSPNSGSRAEKEIEPDLVGLVLFSFHGRSTGPSSTSAAVPSPLSTFPSRRATTDRNKQASPAWPRDRGTGSRTLFVPNHPNEMVDLIRRVTEHQNRDGPVRTDQGSCATTTTTTETTTKVDDRTIEVWVWNGGFDEVELNEDETTWRIDGTARHELVERTVQDMVKVKVEESRLRTASEGNEDPLERPEEGSRGRLRTPVERSIRSTSRRRSRGLADGAEDDDDHDADKLRLEIVWDDGVESRRDMGRARLDEAKKRERVRKGLVCTKFGLVV